MSEKLKVELGGGRKPRDGFLNVDCTSEYRARVDFLVDLERVGPEHLFPRGISRFRTIWGPLPFPDDSVCELYSAHCLEHVQNIDGVLYEIGRICHNGARVEIRVPHYLHPDAMCPSHKHVIGENSARGWAKMDLCGKCLDLRTVERVPSLDFEELRELHPGWKDDQILRFVPGACLEVGFVFNVRRVSK